MEKKHFNKDDCFRCINKIHFSDENICILDLRPYSYEAEIFDENKIKVNHKIKDKFTSQNDNNKKIDFSLF